VFSPLRAAQIQPLDDAARAYAVRSEAPLARDLVRAIDELARAIDVGTLTSLIARNDYAGIWNYLGVERLGHALRPALNRLALVHDRAASATLVHLGARVGKAAPSRLRTPDVISLTYDPLDNATVNAQRQAREAVIQQVEQTTQRTAQQVIADGMAQRLSADQIARNVRQTLGLTQQEANAIQSYRRALEQRSASALQRALRDRRFDSSTRAGTLSDDRIDAAAQRYAEKYRAFRADRIARTEAISAANAGRQDAWKQYADRTGRRGTDIRKFWLTAGDELVCPVCRAIPGMNEGGVPMDEPFDTPIGPLFLPPAHPNCRCTCSYEPVDRTSLGARVINAGIQILLDYAGGA
jgi:hypothetical protein